MATDDQDLIRNYIADGSHAAFRELVDRHVDLVYSAARRQVRSADLAEEVTQSAFIALAQNVHRIKPGAPLTAWLYLVARRAAIDALRQDSRRRTREQIAYEIATMKSNSTDWSQVEAVLDEAMEKLPAADRSAILLRYFENRSLRQVGHALGLSDDAAQKRVSRALDQLRVLLSKRGIAVGAAALAGNLSYGAVQSAPIGLGLTISSAAAVAAGFAGPVTVIEASKLFAMTSLQKGIIAATVAAVASAGYYEQRQLSQRDFQIVGLQQQVRQAQADILRLSSERDELLARWDRTSQTPQKTTAPDQGSPAEPVDAELQGVAARVSLLKEKLALDTQKEIPELRLLKPSDWVSAATLHKLETEEDVGFALEGLRGAAKADFSEMISQALWKYAQANDGALPTDTEQLAAYLDFPADRDLLPRYGMMRTGRLKDAPIHAALVAEIASIDGNQETTLYMTGPRTQPSQGDVNIHNGATNDISSPVLAAIADYIKTKTQSPTDPTQLQPFLKTPIDPDRLQAFWKSSGLPDNLHAPRD